MNDEKWTEVIALIKQKFAVTKRETTKTGRTDDIGQDLGEEIEVVIFDGPQGEMKLERTSRPVILDKKVHYGKGSGGIGRIEYKLSPDQKSHKVELFSMVDGEWQKIDIPIERMSL